MPDIASQTPRPVDGSPPQAFGKYVVEKRIGLGGMGEVYKCRQVGPGGFNRAAVVKCIHPHLATDPDFVSMFLDEARVAASLNHPNIVHILEVGEVEETLYIAMEYVAGPTLGSLLRTGRRTQELHYGHVAHLLAGISQGLHHAHHAVDPWGQPLGIIHRDVTPGNIVISMSGEAKLLDFGIARAAGRSSQTQSGILKGKVRYMAPEQVQAIPTVEVRSDIFSLGVCLYEATTGVRPFEGDNEVEVLTRVSAGSFKRPSEVRADYPPELERIVLWAMEKDLERRCPSAADLGAALTSFHSGGPHASDRASLQAWLQRLFPLTDDSSPFRAPPGSSLGSRSAPTAARPAGFSVDIPMDDLGDGHTVANGPSESEPPKRNRRAAVIWLAAGALAVLAVMLWLGHELRPGTRGQEREERAAPPVAARPSSPPEPEPSSAPVPAVTAEATAPARTAPAQDEPRVAPPTHLDEELSREKPGRTGRKHAQRLASAERSVPEADAERTHPRELPSELEARAKPPAPAPTSVLGSTEVSSELHAPAKPPAPSPVLPPPTVDVPAQVPPSGSVRAPVSLGTSTGAGPAARPQASLAQAPRLPRSHFVHNPPELARACLVVEQELVDRGGLPQSTVHGVTAMLTQRLLRDWFPGGSFELYPRAMYFLLLRELSRGTPPLSVAQELWKAHEDGVLRSAVDPSPR